METYERRRKVKGRTRETGAGERKKTFFHRVRKEGLGRCSVYSKEVDIIGNRIFPL